MNNKSFLEITITDVQKVSAVGRTTFYRLFDNITDVLAYLCDNVFEKVGRACLKTTNFDSKETSLKFIQEWMDNKILLKAIVDSNRMDLLYDSHSKYLGTNYNYFFSNRSLSEEQITYMLTTMTACISACLTAWLKNGGHESAEQLRLRLGDCFSTLSEIYK